MENQIIFIIRIAVLIFTLIMLVYYYAMYILSRRQLKEDERIIEFLLDENQKALEDLHKMYYRMQELEKENLKSGNPLNDTP